MQGLVAEETHWINQLFQFCHTQTRQFLWCTCAAKQPASAGSRNFILGTGRKDGGNQHLEGILGLRGYQIHYWHLQAAYLLLKQGDNGIYWK